MLTEYAIHGLSSSRLRVTTGVSASSICCLTASKHGFSLERALGMRTTCQGRLFRLQYPVLLQLAPLVMSTTVPKGGDTRDSP